MDRAWEVLKRLGPAGVLGVAWTSLPGLLSVLLYTYISTIGQWLRGHEEQGLVMYAVGFALLAGAGLVPTYAAAILGGWAFGFALGLPAALAGYAGGAVVGFLIARLASRDRVMELLRQHPRWQAVRDALVGGSWGKTFGIVTLVRLPPNSPFALTNLVLTSVRVPISAYLAGSLVGMAPRTGLVLYIASQFRTIDVGEAMKQQRPWWWLAIGIALTLIVLGVLGAIAQRALARMTGPRPAP